MKKDGIEKLKEIGQHGPVTLGEIKMKLLKFSLYPKLVERLTSKCKGNTSSNVSQILLKFLFMA